MSKVSLPREEQLEEDKGQDIVLEFWGVERSADDARCLPQPAFQCGYVKLPQFESSCTFSIQLQSIACRLEGEIVRYFRWNKNPMRVRIAEMRSMEVIGM